ncbi:Ldh family oxidoreductase [Xenorhabdus khoisanae]|uniref:Ldh family oxidoreductase n=1 Tax=Xenorhabdus khoisanae TaxID=880157 RepID=UPI002358A3D7|nr:Ldh family oxidoreductase [Xenorhabdus khoisanae]MDC9615910.1 Ldh family oxidoreductase [Xenorhabdus khoisanae]
MWYNRIVKDENTLIFIKNHRDFFCKKNNECVFDRILKRQYKEGCSFDKIPVKLDHSSAKLFDLYDCKNIVGTISLKFILEIFLSEKSRKNIIVVKNLENPISLGYHMNILAEQNYMVVAFQTTTPVMAYGDIFKKIVGNNIISFAFPYFRKNIVIDCSLGEISVREIIKEKDSKKSVLTKNGVINNRGEYINDISEIISSGIIKSIGGYKGSAIALGMQIILSGLTGTVHKNESDALDIRGENSLLFFCMHVDSEIREHINKQIEDLIYKGVYIPG